MREFLRAHHAVVLAVVLSSMFMFGCEGGTGLNRSLRVYNRTGEPIIVEYHKIHWLIRIVLPESKTIEAGDNATIDVHFDDDDDYLARVHVSRGGDETSFWITNWDSSLSVGNRDFD